MLITELRVIPPKIEVKGVVLITPSRIIKIFSPEASETKPAESNISASSYPLDLASIFARTELT